MGFEAAGTKYLFVLEAPQRSSQILSPIDATRLASFLLASALSRLQLSLANQALKLISDLAHRGGGLDTLLRETKDVLRTIFVADGCSIFLLDPEKDRLVLAATTGIVDPSTNKRIEHIEYPMGEGCTGWIWKQRRTLRLLDARDEKECRLLDPTGALRLSTRSAERRLHQKQRPPSFLGSPLLLGSPTGAEQRVVGVIRLHKESTTEPFSQFDEELLQTASFVLAPAIERWRIIADMKSQLELQRGLFDIIEAMHSDDHTSLDAILDKIASASMSFLKAYAVLVFVKDSDADVLELRKWVGPKRPPNPHLRIPFGEGLSGVAAAEGQAIACPDVRKDDRYIEVFPDVKSEASIPILLGARCLGVLCVESLDPGRFKSTEDFTIEVLTIFAKQAAIAIHRAAVLEERDKWREHLVRTTEMVTASSVASGLAHELKNGLATISGMAENLQRVPGVKLSKDNAERLDRIKSESAALFKLTKRLMELSKLGQPEIDFVYLNDVITRRVTLLRELIEAKKIKLVERLDPKLDKPSSGSGVLVPLDTRQIEQVLTNLILNAVDASARGQRIEVSTRLVNDNTVSFSVKDFGVGIAPEDKKQLFEMFYTTKDHGFGVGLYVVKLLVEQNHGGHIDLESKEGKGTVFAVTLPLER